LPPAIAFRHYYAIDASYYAADCRQLITLTPLACCHYAAADIELNIAFRAAIAGHCDCSHYIISCVTDYTPAPQMRRYAEAEMPPITPLRRATPR